MCTATRPGVPSVDSSAAQPWHAGPYSRRPSSLSLEGHRDQHGPQPSCRLLQCEQCRFKTPFQSHMKIHRRSHTGERPFQCSQCSKAFVRKSHLVAHLRVHTGERPHQCSHCGKAFKEKGTLVAHLRVHTGERPYRCHLCPMACTKMTNLARHVRSHTREGPFRCQFCPEAFPCRLQQKTHEEKEHNHREGESSLWAKISMFVIRSSPHRTSDHCPMLVWKCDCGWELWQTVASCVLHKHLVKGAGPLVLSAYLNPFYCCAERHNQQGCSVSFPSVDGCSRQHRPQPSRGLLHCRQCSFTTVYPSKLKAHQRIHTGERPFQCSHCDKAFAEKRTLVAHLRIHTGERPFQCFHCGKAFAERSTLVTHLRIHTGERPFRCHLCPMTFTQRGTLARHVRSHVGERPFWCCFCPEAFTGLLQQKTHEEKEHNHP
ncbi:uncharacterized protein LOC144179897 [Haemaphysalis longicornis]